MAISRRTTLSPTDGWGPLPPHATPPRRRAGAVLRWVERLLVIVGVASLGYYAYVSAETALYQAYEMRELDAILASGPAVESGAVSDGKVLAGEAVANDEVADHEIASVGNTVPAAAARVAPAPGSAIGRLEIPRLGVSAVVRAGSDARTLQLAIGHIPGTALPGDAGNIGLAAHRDTFFRRLGDVRTGDHVRVVTPAGTFLYEVAGTEVVEPTDVWVLDPTERPTLTLVTCYPFSYIGPAPRRFIVRAVLASS